MLWEKAYDGGINAANRGSHHHVPAEVLRFACVHPAVDHTCLVCTLGAATGEHKRAALVQGLVFGEFTFQVDCCYML